MTNQNTDLPADAPTVDPHAKDVSPAKKVSVRVRTVVVAVEIGFVAGLLLIWLLSDSVRHSRSLWILFFYSFPSEFLIAAVPHEPIFFYFGKFYSPLLVAGIAVSSTVLTEALNYSVFGYFTDLKVLSRVRESGITKRIVDLFYRAPFTALIIGGLSPIPFYPLRFLVVLARYPVGLYLLAVFLSRAPRFFILALLGKAFELPNWLLAVFFGSSGSPSGAHLTTRP
ncbi:MAG: VTT domain-containing protein [bacterium]